MRFLQDLHRPVDGSLGKIVEQGGIEKLDRCRIMIAEQDDGASFPDDLHALIRLGAVSDDIPQTDYFVDRLFPDIFKHRFERLEVGMDIGYKSAAHRSIVFDETECDWANFDMIFVS